ncbi:hypothetical protein DFH11DRAFT_1514418 [Phellopilus nigrolimitatus]|nr:hypothetical protein DFH11DRAFT_1514418 [Phellopilus nigrolimitatus]
MSSNTNASAKPDLKEWTRERLSALYTAPTEDAFHASFESAFAPACAHVRLNGEEVERNEFKSRIMSMRAPMTSADVKWEDLNTVEEEEARGTVSGSWTVVRSLKFRLRAAPAQMKRVITFNARVEPGDSAGEDDPRRIVSLTETVEDSHVPAYFPHRPVANPAEQNARNAHPDPDPDEVVQSDPQDNDEKK